MLHHVVANTVPYSKAVWLSLTAEERAVMLEPFTIGLPGDGLDDPGEQIPLLNCVSNQVLGLYGNALILPFHIPAELAEREKVTTRDIQEALIRFHRQAFRPPRTSITLPTRGVLGEAVLGNCESCEKIDVTRFWNWTDSPIPQAADPKALLANARPTLLGKGPAEGPSALVPAQPGNVNLIGNIGTGQDGTAAPATKILEELLKATEPDTSKLDLTGLPELKTVLEDTLDKAGKARATALSEAKGLAEKALTDVPKFMSLQNEIVRKIAGDAGSIAGLIGQGDDAAAAEGAKSELGKVLKPDDLTLDQKAELFRAFSDADEDDEATKRGKAAIRTFLGLAGN